MMLNRREAIKTLGCLPMIGLPSLVERPPSVVCWWTNQPYDWRKPQNLFNQPILFTGKTLNDCKELIRSHVMPEMRRKLRDQRDGGWAWFFETDDVKKVPLSQPLDGCPSFYWYVPTDTTPRYEFWRKNPYKKTDWRRTAYGIKTYKIRFSH